MVRDLLGCWNESYTAACSSDEHHAVIDDGCCVAT